MISMQVQFHDLMKIDPLESYWGVAPQEVENPIVMNVINDNGEYDLDNKSGFREAIIQMDFYAKSNIDIAAANTMLASKDGYLGDETSTIKSIQRKAVRVSDDRSDPSNIVYRLSIDWSVWYDEAVSYD